MEELGGLIQMNREALNEGFEPGDTGLDFDFKRSLWLLCGEQTVEVRDGS